jgi:hypothetical protein
MPPYKRTNTAATPGLASHPQVVSRRMFRCLWHTSRGSRWVMSKGSKRAWILCSQKPVGLGILTNCKGLFSGHRLHPCLVADRQVVLMTFGCLAGSGLADALARGRRLARNGGVISNQYRMRMSAGLGLDWVGRSMEGGKKKPCCLFEWRAGLQEACVQKLRSDVTLLPAHLRVMVLGLGHPGIRGLCSGKP